MIDIRELRDHPDVYIQAARDKRIDADIPRLLELDQRLKDVKARLQDIATEKNRIGKSVPKLSGAEKEAALRELSRLKQEEEDDQNQVKQWQPQFDALMLQVPQPADADVPVGRDDTENVELRREGEVPQFDFEVKDHVELGVALNMIDIERGVKLAGTRNYFLKGDGALLHWAVLRFAIDFMVERGYVPISVPLLMRDEAMQGTGYYPGAEEQTYRMEKDQLSLVGTAEVPLTAYRMGEILQDEELPLKFVALSSCFRREAGAAGKDTYGLYRIHQFDKVEQVVICRNSDEESARFHEEILANSEGVMKALGLPYRVVVVCTGDLGRGQAKKYDIEAWMPSRGNYCETHSASKFYDFQSRRMNLRYKDTQTKKNLFCHTLNNTVIASPRVLIPLMELYQNPDGSITIPTVLRPYMGGREKIAAQS
ncbi:MAG: serine--tRNA ligase [Sedimentisphaerales bacterium]|jgi:seryl-tRNA synthetase|nr:serine--tRNA ligase [Sedimentisphaerales bacterium]HNY79236.1 serine--tRNA ligase [Sedimentisphaerales bacterium]HOC61524.1 serine--tRNA ligase [Sedimentisphaerales bacterium]HOH65212.1 serine--tRNA ligase [Sedimentisphaerales bacterium]HQA89342.1 serine--tRNA ligase [Sedimentisphaerales bacterium]